MKNYQIKAEEIIELAKLNSKAGYNLAIKDIINLIIKFNMHGHKYLLNRQGLLFDCNLKDDLIKEINKLN